MKYLTIFLLSMVALEANAYCNSPDYLDTDVKIVWCDTAYSHPSMSIADNHEAMELVDGSMLYMITDGFYYSFGIVGGPQDGWSSPHDYLFPEEADKARWTFSQNYNYFMR